MSLLRRRRRRRRHRPAATATPHDALIKATFSQVEHAASILRDMLPLAIVQRLDFTTLVHCPGSFVDRALKARHADLLFSVKLSGQTAFVYVLFEHQSRVDPLMAFRLLVYMVRIWEDYLGNHPKERRLPAILPVVLHHSESGWQAPVTFEALLDVDPETLAVLSEHVPRFRFVLDDISVETDDALRQRTTTPLNRLVLWCLRHGREPDELLRRLAGWAELIRQIRAAPGGVAALEVIWRYILSISEPMPPEELFIKLLDAVGKEAEEEIVSVADLLHERGRLKGLAEGERKGLAEGERKGLAEGKRKGLAEGERKGLAEGERKGLAEGERRMLLRLLRTRFGELPADVMARIRAADTAQLELWTDRVLTAPTLAAVLGDV